MATRRLTSRGEILADVLGQVARSEPGLAERPGADRQIAEQLDVDVATAPRLADGTLGDPAADGEVGMQAVAAGMPLGRPQVWEGLANGATEATEEVGQVAPKRARIVVACPRVGEGAEPVQPVRGAVATDLGPCPTGRVRGRLFGIRSGGLAARRIEGRGPEAAAAFGRVRIQDEAPSALSEPFEFRPMFK